MLTFFLFVVAFVALILGAYSTWKVSEKAKAVGSGSGSGSTTIYTTKADVEALMKSNGIWCTADGGCVVPRDLNVGTNKLRIGNFDVHNNTNAVYLDFAHRDNPKAVVRFNSSDHSSVMVRDNQWKDTWIYN